MSIADFDKRRPPPLAQRLANTGDDAGVVEVFRRLFLEQKTGSEYHVNQIITSLNQKDRESAIEYAKNLRNFDNEFIDNLIEYLDVYVIARIYVMQTEVTNNVESTKNVKP